MTQLYGADWRHVLRDRSGRVVGNASGGVAQPTGPLRDALREPLEKRKAKRKNNKIKREFYSYYEFISPFISIQIT